MYTFLESSHQAGSNHMNKPYCVFNALNPGFAPEWLTCRCRCVVLAASRFHQSACNKRRATHLQSAFASHHLEQQPHGAWNVLSDERQDGGGEGCREGGGGRVRGGGRVLRVGGGGGGWRGGGSRGGHRDAGRPSCEWPVEGLRPGQALNGLLCLCV